MPTFKIEKIFNNWKEKDVNVLVSCEVSEDGTTLIIPDEVEELKSNCFKGLKNIKKLILSDKIARIYGLSFKELESLEYIDIKNVICIDSGPFFDCRRLKTIKSNHKLVLDRYSLLHCFSLKEINCNEKDIVKALGDTEIFDYPLLNKELDVARMKIDFDFHKAKNQKEYLDSWTDNFENRCKKELIVFDSGKPTFVVTDSGFSRDNLIETNIIYYQLADNISHLGPFSFEGDWLPYPNVYKKDTSYDEFVNNVEQVFVVKLGDYQSPRSKIDNLEDAIYFFKGNYLEHEIFTLSLDLTVALRDGLEFDKTDELFDITKQYVSMLINYFTSQGDTDKVEVLKAHLNNSHMWKDAYIDKVIKIEKENPHRGTEDAFESLEMLFPECGELADFSSTFNRGVCNKLYKFLAIKLGLSEDIDIEKYRRAPYDADECRALDYYSMSFAGELNRVICSIETVTDKDDIYSDLGLFWDLDYDNEGLFRKNSFFLMYTSYFLRNDAETIHKAIDNGYDDLQEPAYWPSEKYEILLDDHRESTIKSSYLWYTCGLKPEDIDYFKFIIDYQYFNKIMPKGKWSYFLVAFDIENIILSHDFKSFKMIYDLTKNMKDGDWYQPNNFYFNETAFVTSDDSIATINILNEEGFNTICEISDQPID